MVHDLVDRVFGLPNRAFSKVAMAIGIMSMPTLYLRFPEGLSW
jgi:hypothetical protein